MTVRVRKKSCKQSVSKPGTSIFLQCDDANEPWQNPDIRRRGNDRPLLEILAHFGDDEELFVLDQLAERYYGQFLH